jgi:hypothetical protein
MRLRTWARSGDVRFLVDLMFLMGVQLFEKMPASWFDPLGAEWFTVIFLAGYVCVNSSRLRGMPRSLAWLASAHGLAMLGFLQSWMKRIFYSRFTHCS